MSYRDLSAQQKAVVVTRKFLRGEKLTANQVAEMFDMTPRGARKMLENISGTLEIVDMRAGPSQPARWQMFDYD